MTAKLIIESINCLGVNLKAELAFCEQWICLRPRPHVSGDFCIRKFFYADTKISASTRSVYESYTTVHTYPIRIRTSQRIGQQSSRGKRLVLILWRQRIQKYTDTSVHTYPDTQRIQKFPLWRAYTEISGYTERMRRTREDARCIRIKKFADAKISEYVWTGPKRGDIREGLSSPIWISRLLIGWKEGAQYFN